MEFRLKAKQIPTQILGSVWLCGFITLINIKLLGLKVIFVWAVLYASLCDYNRQWSSFDCVVWLTQLQVCSWNCNHCVTTATRLIESSLTDKWTKCCNNRYALQKIFRMTIILFFDWCFPQVPSAYRCICPTSWQGNGCSGKVFASCGWS